MFKIVFASIFNIAICKYMLKFHKLKSFKPMKT
jgi:hypothetical protein